MLDLQNPVRLACDRFLTLEQLVALHATLCSARMAAGARLATLGIPGAWPHGST